jgi:hypothetical protein
MQIFIFKSNLFSQTSRLGWEAQLQRRPGKSLSWPLFCIDQIVSLSSNKYRYENIAFTICPLAALDRANSKTCFQSKFSPWVINSNQTARTSSILYWKNRGNLIKHRKIRNKAQSVWRTLYEFITFWYRHLPLYRY